MTITELYIAGVKVWEKKYFCALNVGDLYDHLDEEGKEEISIALLFSDTYEIKYIKVSE